MFRAVVAILALAVATACTDDEAYTPPNDASSHVAAYFLRELDPHRLDLLLVIDDTTAMAPHQERLARLPRETEAGLMSIYGGLPDLRIAVTTTGGALRTSPEVAEPFLAIELHPDGPRTANFTGSLADALAPLVDVGATRSAANQLLDAAGSALANGQFLRADARLMIVTVSAGDDASLASPVDYASAVKAMKTDPSHILVHGIYPAGLPRLDAFHAAFPGHSSVLSMTSTDWTGAFAVPASFPEFTWWGPTSVESGCFPRPLDVDPVTPGEQLECSMSYWSRDVELEPLPMCGTEEPCWELVDEPACSDVAPMTLELRRSEFGHPEVRGQCLVR